MYLILADIMTYRQSVKRLSDNACIPFDPANTDYQSFKDDLAKGVELKDAEGNTMPADEIAAFMSQLP